MISCAKPSAGLGALDPVDRAIWETVAERRPTLWGWSRRIDRADASLMYALVDQHMDWVTEAKKREAADSI